jgi:hypothetical protein
MLSAKWTNADLWQRNHDPNRRPKGRLNADGHLGICCRDDRAEQQRASDQGKDQLSHRSISPYLT